jgi:hypothetical protein
MPEWELNLREGAAIPKPSLFALMVGDEDKTIERKRLTLIAEIERLNPTACTQKARRHGPEENLELFPAAKPAPILSLIFNGRGNMGRLSERASWTNLLRKNA